MDTTIRGERLQLSPERAVYWPRRKMLLIADPHFGKGGVFRRAGLAVPSGDTATDLDRLSRLFAQTGARHLMILGDFLHAPPRGDEAWLDVFARWRESHRDMRITVTRGNHDRLPELPAHWDIEWLDGAQVQAPFLLQHEPEASDLGYVLAGHLHPVVRLGGRGDSMRSPVFWFGHEYAVLPAFGSFTGGATIRPRAGERLFAVGPEVVELSLAEA